MMEPVADEVLKKACEAFSEAYAIYPDGSGKTPITDWFEIDAQDAVDFGVLKVARWSYHTDIRGDEYRAYVATVIREPMRAALSVRLSDAEARIAELEEKAEDAEQLRRLFDQQWKRTREAGELWRQAHPGNDNVSPDLGELVKWLIDRAEAAEALLKEAKTALEPFADEADCYEPDEGDNDLSPWATPAYFKIRHLRAARAIHDKIGGRNE